ncbi:Protein of unknown function [Oscillibacter sp. PC13]|uniref:DUF975 family protein n=1 Tax=Oscillibacter sp. PC13 TaxID=1855299 RepID=UPI0008E03B36|nr:DUF975 family protein [Oscillibacter sp. PC13]SFP28550.1 Protein of unknown function [Oscillibacter sp. PC13]
MMAQIVDRKALKAQMRSLLHTAQVSPKGFTALYLILTSALNLVDSIAGGTESGLLGTFVTVLTSLLGMILGTGFVLYCMAIRRGERAEYLTLFDGFSFVGKVIGLNIVMYAFVTLWSLLFVIPGVIAAYRYRFALYNLYENPGIGIMEALDMSKQQTYGYKGQLFVLDWSYFGWGLLASIPSLTLIVPIARSAADMVFSGQFFSVEEALAAMPHFWGATLLGSLWSLAVQLFYLPNYQCTELGYFEIAKQTSGVGFGSVSGGHVGGSSGPDDLGGLDGWNSRF